EHLITAKIYLQSYVFIGSLMTFFSNMLFYMYIEEYTGVPFKDLVFTYGTPNFRSRYPDIDDDKFNNFHVNTGQCVTFVALVIMQWGMFSSLLMAIFVTEVPWINQIMLTNPVPIKYWLLPFPCALAVLIADEMRKLMLRSFPNSIFGKLAW
ncbi:ATPase Na K transporting alpha, partial [Linnemannia gamsii]